MSFLIACHTCCCYTFHTYPGKGKELKIKQNMFNLFNYMPTLLLSLVLCFLCGLL